MANNRRFKALSVIVTDHVRTRKPVGSRALVERYRLGVSPATIRNGMAALENEGYIHQPHTLARRVPTQKGYRLFVDEVAHIKPLSAPERATIIVLLSGAVDLERVVAHTARALAQLTGQLAIVGYPNLRYTALQHLELVTLGLECVLLVIITGTGHADQRAVTLRSRSSVSTRHDRDFGITDVVDPLVLEHLHIRLNDVLTGRRAADVAPILAALAEQASADERLLLETVPNELVAALCPNTEEWLVVAGTANLACATPDFSSLGPFLNAVEEQVVLPRLFTIDNGAPADKNRMRMSVGSGNNDDALVEASVVTTTCGPGTDEAVAHLGIIGPTRMDYPATMTAVQAMAHYLPRFLSSLEI